MAKNGIMANAIVVFGKRTLRFSRTKECHVDTAACVTRVKKTGHTMHFPGAVPFTGLWCKFHYYRMMILHPIGSIRVFIWGAGVIGGIIALVLKIGS